MQLSFNSFRYTEFQINLPHPNLQTSSQNPCPPPTPSIPGPKKFKLSNYYLSSSNFILKMNSKSSRSTSETSDCMITETIRKGNSDPVQKKYLKGRFLGKGGFAKVYEFTDIDSKASYAGKIIEKSTLSKPRTRQKLMSEIKIHKSLRHPNIVRFDHHFEDSENVYILLELCQNQTLTELIRRRKRLTEMEVQCYTIQIISALKYLHSHKVIHRDIKLGNLFLNEKLEVKMGDFGLATKLEYDGERKRTICGTPNYIAPEILEGKSGHSYEVDVWSLGVLVFTLLVGKPPFETSDVKSTYRKIRMNTYAFPEHVSVSDEAKNFVRGILVTEPSLRPGVDELLSHSFLNRNGIPKLMPLSSLAVPPTLNHSSSQGARPRSRGETLSIPITRTLSNLETMPFTARDTQNLPKPYLDRPEGKKPCISSYNPSNSENLWVKKWVDYSSKYGIGYLLSNNAVGVYFNDSTKIISISDTFDYFSRSAGQDSATYSLKDFPENLKKKVTLLEHFKKHLQSESKPQECKSNLVYLKKWLSTSHAMFFRLSNRVVQVAFLDKSELLLCSDKKIVIFVDKKGLISEHNLATAMESPDKELTKRLRYSKEVLTTMLQPVKV